VALEDVTDLEERVLLLALELVRAEDTETTSGLLVVETTFAALKQLEDVVDYYSLQVDLLLVVKVLGLELNLNTDDETNQRAPR
jgi:hypothetical protein